MNEIDHIKGLEDQLIKVNSELDIMKSKYETLESEYTSLNNLYK